MTSDRKPHVHVEQHYYFDWVKDYGPTTIDTFVGAFDVSEATAKRYLDGLIVQGKIKYNSNTKEYSYDAE